MTKRKETKWSIERVNGASERNVNATDTSTRGYPTLLEMQRSQAGRAKIASAVGKFLVPILLAGAMQSTACVNTAQADDPPPPPPVQPPPLAGAPMPSHIDPPPPPPPPPPARHRQHAEQHGHRRPPPPPPSGSHNK